MVLLLGSERGIERSGGYCSMPPRPPLIRSRAVAPTSPRAPGSLVRSPPPKCLILVRKSRASGTRRVAVSSDAPFHRSRRGIHATATARVPDDRSCGGARHHIGGRCVRRARRRE